MKRSFRLQLKAIAIALLALILITGPIVAATKPNHTKANVNSTVIDV